MMMKSLAQRVCGCVVSLLFCFLSIRGQYTHKPLRTITTKDGLPQSFVSGMVQDRDGFVWIGTRNGLARYDGMHFKVFQHSNRDSSTLHSNLIVSVKIDKRNHIWLSYEEANRIDCFDPVAHTVEHIDQRRFFISNPNVFSSSRWIPASNGSIWGGLYHTGLALYDWRKNKTTQFTAASKQLLDDTICGLLEDHRNVVWAVTRLGLSRYDSVTGKFNSFQFPFRFVTNGFLSIQERRDGELMFGDREKLIFFNPSTARFRTLPVGNNNDPVDHIQTGSDGNEYFQKSNIIYRYDDSHGAVAMVTCKDFIVSMLVDRSGLVWLGTNGAGISQIDPNAPAFEAHPTVRTFHYDLLKQEFGLELNKTFHYRPEEMKYFVGTSYFLRSTYDAQKHLYITLSDWVSILEPAQQKWTQLPRIPRPSKKTYIRPAQDQQSIDVSPDGRLWAVNDNHFIGYFDSSSRKWITFMDSNAVRSIERLDELLDVKLDRNKIWITTSEGLLCIDLFSKKIQEYNKEHYPQLLPTNNLQGMERDPTRPDLLWIGSMEGLICLDKKKLRTEIFTTHEGLPDNTIYSIQTDSAGFLWLSTNQGLCRFHPVTHEVRNFKAEDGLPGNEFNRFHHFKLPDGRLAFGGMEGWVVFNPNTIKPDTYQPQTAFTGLKIYNEPVNYAPGNKLLPNPLNEAQKLVLPYDQNTLTFSFSGLEYNHPDELHYRYRLKNFDDKWITTDDPVAAYTRLAPGNYTLEINCTNTIGQWSTYVRSLPVTILPPWWRTWWACTVYILIITGVGLFLFRIWMQRTKTKQQIFLQQKEAEQLKAVDEMKSRFFANIVHEFRTPLSLIIAPAEQMENEEPSPAWKKQVNIIRRNARQLLQLVNQLMDMAKLEADNMKVVLYRGNIGQFSDQLVQSFLSAATVKKVQLHFIATTDDEEYLFDADKLYTVVANLLSNAIKFTAAGGAVEVTVEQKKMDEQTSAFSFNIRDTGIGIAPDKLPFIFNRFYQVDDSATRSYGGTGIGLALAKELADLMLGTITVTSERGRGTFFTFTLPLTNASGIDAPLYSPVTTLPELPETALYKTTDANVITALHETSHQSLVLIAEDNIELNNFITASFKQHYRVLSVANGTEALELASKELPDIIVSDWMMPGIDGLTLCRAIKTGTDTSHIAFVMLTARSAPASRIEGLQSMADDYIMKPFVAEELLLRVTNILQRRQKLQSYFQHQLDILIKTREQPVALKSEEPQQLHPFLQQLYEVIDEHLDDVDFSVEELATKAAVSTRTLSRKLSSIIGLSAAELIKQYRLKKASEFLKQGMNVTETRYKIGYDSAAHFNVIFKAKYGITPGEYAKSEIKS